ncbi:metal ABC transporter ATP-binding protein [Thiomicrospira microaerophila]|uniref:metal ABC transporter ATP-binding protein n=1 Tax=Thiomicrospira microaerophila TaxID=406020 RepID=UPI00200E31AA|nr:metal ABC transporter ATP-binding protein [Thiomicrospira microaerophila]UQB41291.1 metal ABC transporter ATP-binding protein [Thiomicrospira microaerophila]
MNSIETHNLSLGYNHIVLKEISLSLPTAERIAIIGPNGAGKSTFLKGLINLLPIRQGEVSFLGKTTSHPPIAYVPQREEVDWDFPINVYDVVMMGRHGYLKFWQRPSQEDHQIVKQCLKQVNMESFSERQISQLSGGQQQRVFIARALAQQAPITLMDEPFAGVDMATEKALATLFSNLKYQGQTLICVHHDLNSLRDYFDWVVMINHGLVAYGPIEQQLTLDNLQQTFDGRLPILEKLTQSTADL